MKMVSIITWLFLFHAAGPPPGALPWPRGVEPLPGTPNWWVPAKLATPAGVREEPPAVPRHKCP